MIATQKAADFCMKSTAFSYSIVLHAARQLRIMLISGAMALVILSEATRALQGKNLIRSIFRTTNTTFAAGRYEIKINTIRQHNMYPLSNVPDFHQYIPRFSGIPSRFG